MAKLSCNFLLMALCLGAAGSASGYTWPAGSAKVMFLGSKVRFLHGFFLSSCPSSYMGGGGGREMD